MILLFLIMRCTPTIAAGHDSNIGLDEEETGQRISEAQAPLIAQLATLADQIAREKGVPSAALRIILAKLGQIDVPENEIASRLDAAAVQFVELRRQLARYTNERPQLAVIRKKALALIDDGDLDGARSALDAGRQVARTLREEATRSEVELLVDEARIDTLQLAHRGAAQKYAEAARLLALFDPMEVRQLLRWQANALHDEGRQSGDNKALVEATTIHRDLLSIISRSSTPFFWACIQSDLGTTLATLGEHERSTELLGEAVSAIKLALEEMTAERNLTEWATIQNQLCQAFMELGACENEGASLELALAASSEVLNRISREKSPDIWSTAQHNRGVVCTRLGEREIGTTRLEEALAAYRDVLKETERSRSALAWANAQSNLGVALLRCGEREQNSSRIEEAVAAFRGALEEKALKLTPLSWATTLDNLGNALFSLGTLENNTLLFEQSLEAHQEALKQRTRDQMPADWATTQHNIASTLVAIGTYKRDSRYLERAVLTYEQALEQRTKEKNLRDYAESLGDQGIALEILATFTSDFSLAKRALRQISEAYQIARGVDEHRAAGLKKMLAQAFASLERLRGKN
jgi:tetratricopeptide (TPR) repeat protein